MLQFSKYYSNKVNKLKTNICNGYVSRNSFFMNDRRLLRHNYFAWTV